MNRVTPTPRFATPSFVFADWMIRCDDGVAGGSRIRSPRGSPLDDYLPSARPILATSSGSISMSLSDVRKLTMQARSANLPSMTAFEKNASPLF